MKTNTRRDFLKTTLALGATATLAAPALRTLAASKPAKTTPASTAKTPATTAATPDVVAIKGGTRAAMLDRAIAELGGIAAFVKKGQKVVIKPNIGWDRDPDLCANTHPDIIARLVALCLGAGASEVSVFDHTCHPWEKCYKNSGIADAVKTAGGRMLPGNDESYYREVKVPGGVTLTTVQIHKAVLDSDVFINVPVLKVHGGGKITACMKNLMGMIWDRKFYHKNDLHQCIVDVLHAKKPDLNILDAYHPMMRNGPQGKSSEDLLTDTKTLLASRDIVAIDAAGAKILGKTPDDIGHIRIAAESGFGRIDLEKLNIARIKMTA